MSLIKQVNDKLIIIGICGNTHEQNQWKIFIHNYSVTTGQFYSVSNCFGYFLAELEKFEEALSLSLSHEAFIKKEISGKDCTEGKDRWIFRQKAREFIRNIPEENFYSRLISPYEPYKFGENSFNYKENEG